jgi:two-component system response regulator DesR
MTEQSGVIQANRIRVLLVDDSQTFLRAAQQYLRTEPELELVSVLSDPEQALEQLDHIQPDLVLTDLNMLKMTGLELISALRTRSSKVAIIALTLWNTASYRQAAFLAGADGFVSKESMVRDLMPTVRRIIYPRITRVAIPTTSQFKAYRGAEA